MRRQSFATFGKNHEGIMLRRSNSGGELPADNTEAAANETGQLLEDNSFLSTYDYDSEESTDCFEEGIPIFRRSSFGGEGMNNITEQSCLARRQTVGAIEMQQDTAQVAYGCDESSVASSVSNSGNRYGAESTGLDMMSHLSTGVTADNVNGQGSSPKRASLNPFKKPRKEPTVVEQPSLGADGLQKDGNKLMGYKENSSVAPSLSIDDGAHGMGSKGMRMMRRLSLGIVGDSENRQGSVPTPTSLNLFKKTRKEPSIMTRVSIDADRGQKDNTETVDYGYEDGLVAQSVSIDNHAHGMGSKGMRMMKRLSMGVVGDSGNWQGRPPRRASLNPFVKSGKGATRRASVGVATGPQAIMQRMGIIQPDESESSIYTENSEDKKESRGQRAMRRLSLGRVGGTGRQGGAQPQGAYTRRLSITRTMGETSCGVSKKEAIAGDQREDKSPESVHENSSPGDYSLILSPEIGGPSFRRKAVDAPPTAKDDEPSISTCALFSPTLKNTESGHNRKGVHMANGIDPLIFTPIHQRHRDSGTSQSKNMNTSYAFNMSKDYSVFDLNFDVPESPMNAFRQEDSQHSWQESMSSNVSPMSAMGENKASCAAEQFSLDTMMMTPSTNYNAGEASSASYYLSTVQKSSGRTDPHLQLDMSSIMEINLDDPDKGDTSEDEEMGSIVDNGRRKSRAGTNSIECQLAIVVTTLICAAVVTLLLSLVLLPKTEHIGSGSPTTDSSEPPTNAPTMTMATTAPVPETTLSTPTSAVPTISPKGVILIDPTASPTWASVRFTVFPTDKETKSPTMMASVSPSVSPSDLQGTKSNQTTAVPGSPLSPIVTAPPTNSAFFTAPPAAACLDDPDIFFYLGGFKRNCAWLSVQTSVTTLVLSCHRAGDKCRATCKNCYL